MVYNTQSLAIATEGILCAYTTNIITAEAPVSGTVEEEAIPAEV